MREGFFRAETEFLAGEALKGSIKSFQKYFGTIATRIPSIYPFQIPLKSSMAGRKLQKLCQEWQMDNGSSAHVFGDNEILVTSFGCV